MMHYTKIKYQVSHATKLLFIGTNPSPGTYRRGVPFSNNKSFWYLLRDAGLIDEDKKQLQNDIKLKTFFMHEFIKKYHLGLINLVYRPTKSVAQIKKKEALPGRKRILAAISIYHPNVVCFIGKGTYQLFMQSNYCHYGWQPSIHASKIFVMHSPIHGFARTRIKELKEVAKISQI